MLFAVVSDDTLPHFKSKKNPEPKVEKLKRKDIEEEDEVERSGCPLLYFHERKNKHCPCLQLHQADGRKGPSIWKNQHRGFRGREFG